MEYTYAEVKPHSVRSSTSSNYGSISSFNSSAATVFSQFDLPLEYRYPRRSPTSARSSGYCSAVSSSSVNTVINATIPYHPTNSIKTAKKSRPCCIQCRETELRHLLDIEDHQYQNFDREKVVDPYVFLMSSVMRHSRKEDGGRAKVAKVQQKVEKLLRLPPRETLSVHHNILFNRQLACFARDVEIRLRAVKDVSPETFREISAKFCEALHGTSNNNGFKSIFKGVKKFLFQN